MLETVRLKSKEKCTKIWKPSFNSFDNTIASSTRTIFKILDSLESSERENKFNQNLFDCHGSKDNHHMPVQDDTQNYHIESGYQNLTHTSVTFRRALETCDPHDVIIGFSLI
uniref:DOMON domain-containing protein n=1 Tax=Anopheles maculatus TaxID=74869 RepID=A0A182SYM7_9DIPT